jgi:hypothetical protein
VSQSATGQDSGRIAPPRYLGSHTPVDEENAVLTRRVTISGREQRDTLRDLSAQELLAVAGGDYNEKEILRYKKKRLQLKARVCAPGDGGYCSE